MKCSCINGTYDFDLIYTSCSDIRYIDRSVWMVGPDYAPNATFNLTVTDPAGSEFKYSGQAGSTISLDFGTCPKPGVYKFSVETCGDDASKSKAILCILKCGYLRAVAKLGNGVEVDKLRSIRERIEYIDQLVSYEDLNTARDLTRTVEADLRKINCECSC